MSDIDIESIFESVRNDSSLLNTIDIEQLLDTLENEKSESIENKTLDDILQEIVDVLKENNFKKLQIKDFSQRLAGYRYIENLFDIQKGRFIRWIKEGGDTLTNGGIVVDIKFLDRGTHILCKNAFNKFFQIKFDGNIIFQKLTTGEQLILYVYERIKSK